jgi:signal transduction histidine kinase
MERRPPFAFSSAKAAPPGVTLKAHVTEGAASGEPLGDAFPGLRVQWSEDRFLQAARQGVPLGIWIAGLALVLGIAVFGGYLLLRDVNRDVRMTEVRAQFIASVSHELKTPLTAIRMFAETLSLGRSRDERTRLHKSYFEGDPSGIAVWRDKTCRNTRSDAGIKGEG